MAKKLISFNFNGEFIPELESLSKSHPIAEVNTMYFTSIHSRITDLKTDTYLAEAIANYLGTVDTLHLFVGKTTKNQYVAEYQKPGKDEIQICIGAVTGGSFVFKAGCISEETGVLSQYDAGHKGTIFVMDMFPKIAEDKEASICISDLHAFRVEDESYSKAMCKLFNNIYYRVKDEKSTSPVTYVNEPKKISQNDIDRVEIGRIFCGVPKVFSRLSVLPLEDLDEEVDIPSSSASELRNMYLLDTERVLTEEEEKRVPDLGEWYVVPEWSKKTAKRISTSKKFRKSIGNILLYGPSGTGKTEGSHAIAEMLGLPYYTITCSADDDKFDLIGQLIPNTEKGKSGMDPDCVIAFTINRDYEGCNDLQEAVYSRIIFVMQIPEPTETELFARTKAQTGFYNDGLLRKMAKTIVDIHEYCRDKDITGGVCGPRELIDWAQVSILESEEREEAAISETSVIAAALDTILEKVAQNEDDIEDVITGVFKKHFSTALVDELR